MLELRGGADLTLATAGRPLLRARWLVGSERRRRQRTQTEREREKPVVVTLKKDSEGARSARKIASS